MNGLWFKDWTNTSKNNQTWGEEVLCASDIFANLFFTVLLILTVLTVLLFELEKWLRLSDQVTGFPIQGIGVQNNWVAPCLTQSFILPSSVKWEPGISGNLVVNSKLPPRSDFSLEAVAHHAWKGLIKFKVFLRSCQFTPHSRV